MKVEVNEKAKTVEIVYPCLMISDQGKIVLFIRNGEGTALNDARWTYIGEFNKGWDMDNFKPFHGTITLSNE